MAVRQGGPGAAQNGMPHLAGDAIGLCRDIQDPGMWLGPRTCFVRVPERARCRQLTAIGVVVVSVLLLVTTSADAGVRRSTEDCRR